MNRFIGSCIKSSGCGFRQVMVSDLPSLREWLVDGQGGSFVEIGDVEGLADCLCHALTHPELREAAGLVNREKVALKASRRSTMKQMEQHYEELVGAGHRT